MLIFNSHTGLSKHLDAIRTATGTVGLVPTMGALHEGHLTLLKESLASNTITVISIFVNPTQFNNAEDLAKYPRTFDADVLKIQDVDREIIIYAPTVDDIYNGITASQHFDYDGIENQMEGKFRPGHFDGVGTIVKKLLEIVNPDTAYFGEKDFQQLQIVKKLVSKNNIPVNIVGCPIHREPNGLAMSSRNERLTPALREKAAIIYQALLGAKLLFGTENAKAAIQYVKNIFENDPDFSLEYFEIADEETLEAVETTYKNRKYRAFIAVFANNVRLIDTISLN